MGKWVHRIVDGICTYCGPGPPLKRRGNRWARRIKCNELKGGSGNWISIKRNDKTTSSTEYRVYKKEVCEKCGFVPINKCQLDVDHIDGDRGNSAFDNFQTLCANCHRLKTWEHRDGVWRYRIKPIP